MFSLTLFNTVYNDNGYKYSGSALETKMNELYKEFGMKEELVQPVKLKMSGEQHKGKYVYVCTTGADCAHTSTSCTTYADTNYYTKTDTQADIADTNFFALSLNEVLSAYGDSTDEAILQLRIVQAAPKYVRGIDNVGSGNWNNSTGWKDGDGNPITTTDYWLRSPGYSATRAARITNNGYADADRGVTTDIVGARPACYLNLTSSN